MSLTMTDPVETPPCAPRKALTADDVRRIAGDIDDVKLVAILELGATVAELEAAVAWEEGESDVLGEAREPLSGRVGEIYEILTAGEVWEDERDDA